MLFLQVSLVRDNLAASVFTHPNLSIPSSFPIPESSENYSERFLFEKESYVITE